MLYCLSQNNGGVYFWKVVNEKWCSDNIPTFNIPIDSKTSTEHLQQYSHNGAVYSPESPLSPLSGLSGGRTRQRRLRRIRHKSYKTKPKMRRKNSKKIKNKKRLLFKSRKSKLKKILK